MKLFFIHCFIRMLFLSFSLAHARTHSIFLWLLIGFSTIQIASKSKETEFQQQQIKNDSLTKRK